MRISIPQFPLSFTEESATGCGRRHPDAEEQRIWIPHIRASFRTLPGRHGRSRARPLALRKDHTIDRPRPYAGVTAKRRSPETVCRSGEGGRCCGKASRVPLHRKKIETSEEVSAGCEKTSPGCLSGHRPPSPRSESVGRWGRDGGSGAGRKGWCSSSSQGGS